LALEEFRDIPKSKFPFTEFPVIVPVLLLKEIPPNELLPTILFVNWFPVLLFKEIPKGDFNIIFQHLS